MLWLQVSTMLSTWCGKPAWNAEMCQFALVSRGGMGGRQRKRRERQRPCDGSEHRNTCTRETSPAMLREPLIQFDCVTSRRMLQPRRRRGCCAKSWLVWRLRWMESVLAWLRCATIGINFSLTPPLWPVACPRVASWLLCPPERVVGAGRARACGSRSRPVARIPIRCTILVF